MAGSALVTKLVAVALGVIVGIVGLIALVPTLSPSAEKVSQNVEDAKPGVYGAR
jgi:hypothetical protein